MNINVRCIFVDNVPVGWGKVGRIQTYVHPNAPLHPRRGGQISHFRAGRHAVSCATRRNVGATRIRRNQPHRYYNPRAKVRAFALLTLVVSVATAKFTSNQTVPRAAPCILNNSNNMQQETRAVHCGNSPPQRRTV